MKRIVLTLLLSAVLTSLVFGLDAEASWQAIEMPAADEPGAVAALEAAGITALAWSNALVEVSAFGAVELRPVSKLETSLTEADPRWDPWLRSVKPLFRLGSTSRVWVEAGQAAEASRLLKHPASGAEVPEPRRITGWLVLSFSFLYLILKGASLFLSRREQVRRRWLGLALAGAVLAGGLALVLVPGAAGRPPQSSVSWLRHLWYQQSWPFGARWDDWAPGKAWTYPGFERRAGRITEVGVALPVPGAAWADAAYAGLDPHHAARLFPPENP